MSERVEMWKAQVAEDPDNELSRFSLAQALYAEKLWAEALEQYEAALARKQDWMVAVIQRGQCLIRLGRAAEAKEALLAGKQLAMTQGHKGPQEEIDQILEDLG